MEEENKNKILYVPVEDIIPNRFQPRLAFDEKELNNLSTSIKKYGVIQPIVLRKIGEKYEIIAGERRYKASLLAGLEKIPAIINQTDDNTSAEIALLENIQRKNLTVIEEAQSYKKLLDRGFTQDDIATKLGVSQSSIANKLRLLNLPKQVQDALLYNKISERHARSLIPLNNVDLQSKVLEKIINERLTVRQTEEEISKILNGETDIDKDKEGTMNLQDLLSPPVETIRTPAAEKEMPVQEYLDIAVPEVISITPESEESKINVVEDGNLSINPFQENFINKVEEIKSMDISTEVPNIDAKTELFENKINEEPLDSTIYQQPETPINSVNDSLEKNLEIPKEIGLPKVIEKVRELVNNINLNTSSKITTSEVDLSDKYQIIIEVEKN